ncbi:flagellar export protein FliJ [Thiolapillus sp.]
MKHGESLKTVARVVGNDEREMARRMGDCRLKMEADEQQLLSLQQYRDQYLREFHGAGGGCVNAVQLQDYRVFLGRLDQAIEQQQRLLAESRQAFEDLQQQWLRLRGEKKALQKLIDRRQQRDMAKQARGEQKELDERAGWAYRDKALH